MAHSVARTAQQFIGIMRRNAQLLQNLSLVNGTLTELCNLAEQQGYSFTEAELRTAFKRDWMMRWHRYAQASDE